MKTTTRKKIHFQLVGLDGNAFALLGAFIAQARRESWTKEEIAAVTRDAMSGSYANLLTVLDSHCGSTAEAPPDHLDDENDDQDESDD